MTSEEAIGRVLEEFDSAIAAHGTFSSAHEGYAVILEELDELWDEVRKRTSRRDMDQMRREAIQVGAMALRFIVDLT